MAQIPHFPSCSAISASYSACESPVRLSRDAARRHTRHHGVRQERLRRSRGYQDGSRSVWHLVHLIVGLVVNWSINSYFLELVSLELTSSVFSAARVITTTDQQVTPAGERFRDRSSAGEGRSEHCYAAMRNPVLIRPAPRYRLVPSGVPNKEITLRIIPT